MSGGAPGAQVVGMSGGAVPSGWYAGPDGAELTGVRRSRALNRATAVLAFRARFCARARARTAYVVLRRPSEVLLVLLVSVRVAPRAAPAQAVVLELLPDVVVPTKSVYSFRAAAWVSRNE